MKVESGVYKFFDFINERFEEIIGVVLLGLMVSIIFSGVVLRLVFRIGIPWQEEISRIFYVLVIFLGASYGIKANDHIRVTFVYNKLPRLGKIIVRFITDILWLGFNVFVVAISIKVIGQMVQFKGYSGVLSIPLHLIFGIVPVCTGLLSLRLVQKMVTDIVSGNLEIQT